MQSSPWLSGIPVAAAILGAFLGALLKPLFDEWRERRRKTIEVAIDEPHKIKSPHRDVRLLWREHNVEQIVNTNFSIDNKTGRTIRNFKIKIDTTAKASDLDFNYLTIDKFVGQGNFSLDKMEGSSWTLTCEFMVPKAAIKLFMVSSYAESVMFSTMDDFEIRTRRAGLNRNLSIMGEFSEIVRVILVVAATLTVTQFISGIISG